MTKKEAGTTKTKKMKNGEAKLQKSKNRKKRNNKN